METAAEEKDRWVREGEWIRAMIQEFVFTWHGEKVMECTVDTHERIKFNGRWMRHVQLCLRFVPIEYPYDLWRLFILRTVIIDYLKIHSFICPLRIQIPPAYIPMPNQYPQDTNKFFT